jgi:hypothetical protein
MVPRLTDDLLMDMATDGGSPTLTLISSARTDGATGGDIRKKAKRVNITTVDDAKSLKAAPPRQFWRIGLQLFVLLPYYTILPFFHHIHLYRFYCWMFSVYIISGLASSLASNRLWINTKTTPVVGWFLGRFDNRGGLFRHDGNFGGFSLFGRAAFADATTFGACNAGQLPISGETAGVAVATALGADTGVKVRTVTGFVGGGSFARACSCSWHINSF